MTDPVSWLHAGRAMRIAIVGGGLSGAAVVYHLSRSAIRPLDITLYEPRDHIGHGVAYSTSGDHLLLNVAAGKLSIDPDRPGDFHHWCLARGHDVSASSFLPRSWFGQYVEARLTDQLERARDRVRLQRAHRQVEGITTRATGLSVQSSGGGVHDVDHAVLALGHGPTRVPEAIAPYASSPLVLRSPWDHEAMQRIASRSERVLLIGTGLTMCDAAITLARHGFAGTMTAISRRGLLPQVHAESAPSSLTEWRDAIPTGSLREIRRAVRMASRAHGWRSVVDALRPRTAELWAGLGQTERTRFLDRLAPYWDAHRHRLPPECGAAIALLRERGVLRVLRGSVVGVRARDGGLRCELSIAGASGSDALHADAIVLCTGPEPNPLRWSSPLIRDLVSDGLASPDAMGLGLRSSDAGFLIGRGAVVQHQLSTLGPLRRGSLWESTAVPELAAQAANLARVLADQCDAPRHAGLSSTSSSLTCTITQRST